MGVIIKNLQGSPEWHKYKESMFGASEAAAMLGISKKMTREELLFQKFTGLKKEYSSFVMNLFEKGHESEAKARAIIEDQIGEELYPAVYALGMMIASVDGITASEEIVFEHKLFNMRLHDSISKGILPPEHIPQCQQTMLVTGAKSLIFVCSNGDRESMARLMVYPDYDYFTKIDQGWAYFKRDLDNYGSRNIMTNNKQEYEEISEIAQSKQIMQLPSLLIRINGEVTASNLPQFKEAAELFISKIKTDLKVDDDFANAEETIKFCSDAEKKLELAKTSAISQTASIDELMKTIDDIKESIRAKRLILEKLVKTQKESIKKEIIDDAFSSCCQHMNDISSMFKSVDFTKLVKFLSREIFADVCKNKRTIESLRNATDALALEIKIKLDGLARTVHKNIAHLPDDLSLFRDIQEIITKQEDDFKLLVQSRTEEQKRKKEEEIRIAIEKAKETELTESPKAIQKENNKDINNNDFATTRTHNCDEKSPISNQKKEYTNAEISNFDKGEVTISTEKLIALLKKELMLEALQGCGVDNWDGYDYAMDVYESSLKDFNKLKQTE